MTRFQLAGFLALLAFDFVGFLYGSPVAKYASLALLGYTAALLAGLKKSPRAIGGGEPIEFFERANG